MSLKILLSYSRSWKLHRWVGRKFLLVLHCNYDNGVPLKSGLGVIEGTFNRSYHYQSAIVSIAIFVPFLRHFTLKNMVTLKSRSFVLWIYAWSIHHWNLQTQCSSCLSFTSTQQALEKAIWSKVVHYGRLLKVIQGKATLVLQLISVFILFSSC